MHLYVIPYLLTIRSSRVGALCKLKINRGKERRGEEGTGGEGRRKNGGREITKEFSQESLFLKL